MSATNYHRSFMRSLLRASSYVRRRHVAVCEVYGLTFQQFNVLRILRGAELSGEGPLPTMTVAARMVEPEPGITRIVSQLEKAKSINRIKATQDARCLLCQITTSGQEKLAALDNPIKELVQELLTQFSAEEVETIAQKLDQINSYPLS